MLFFLVLPTLPMPRLPLCRYVMWGQHVPRGVATWRVCPSGYSGVPSGPGICSDHHCPGVLGTTWDVE